MEDLATRWIQSYPCKAKQSQETDRNLRKFLEPSEKPKVIYTDNSLEFGQLLWRIILESLYINDSPFRDKSYCWKRGTQNKRRDVCCTVTIRLGWKVVGWFHGMLLLSAKCSRLPGRRENSAWTAVWRHSVGRSYHLVHWWNAFQSSEIDKARIHQIGKKILWGIFPGYALIAG